MSSKISPPTAEDRRDVAGAGMCAECASLQVMRSSRGSVFVRCALSDEDDAFPRYPRLPMLRCAGWRRFELDESR